MSDTRDIRRLAFQTLYQLDATSGVDAEQILTLMQDDDDDLGRYSAGEKKKAFELAKGAFQKRAEADAFMVEAAPGWPVHRQAAVDRAILRLAYFEMHHTPTPPKVAVNEAVELAKAFSTEKSPAFINGLLDKALKQVLAARGEASESESAPESAPAQ